MSVSQLIPNGMSHTDVIWKFKYDIDSLNRANSENSDFRFTFLDALLDKTTALLAAEHDAVCIFVNDICDEVVLQKLSALNVVRKVYLLLFWLSLIL